MGVQVGRCGTRSCWCGPFILRFNSESFGCDTASIHARTPTRTTRRTSPAHANTSLTPTLAAIRSHPPQPRRRSWCSSALPVPALASVGHYVHAPPLSPVIPLRTFAVTLTRTAPCPHRCRNPHPSHLALTPSPHARLAPPPHCSPHALPCPFCPASTHTLLSVSMPVPICVHTCTSRLCTLRPPVHACARSHAAPPRTCLCTGTPVQSCLRTAAAPPSCALSRPFRPTSSCT
jgi:hypothetical protein